MQRNSRNSERGIALISVMFALLLLTGLAMGLMYMAETETSINYNYRSSQQAYFGAKAGLEEVRVRLLPPHPINGGGGDLALAGLPALFPGAANANSVVYLINPRPGEVINPTTGDPITNPFFDTELCHLNYAALGLPNVLGANVPCQNAPSAPAVLMMGSLDPYTGTAGSMLYKWARVTRKVNSNTFESGVYVDGTNVHPGLAANTLVCWNGRHQQLIPAGQPSCEFDAFGNRTRLTSVYIVSALAITQNGSRRMVSTELAQNPPLNSNGAVESEDEVKLNGQLQVSGYDNCKCECKQVKTPTGGTTLECADRLTGITPCSYGNYSIYSNSVVDDPNKSETLVAPKIPAVAENAPWEQDIPQLIEDFKNAADAVDVRNAPYKYDCLGVPLNCGTHADVTMGTLPTGFPDHDPSNPGAYDNQITYVPGDMKITSNGSVGAGVLVIDGDLEINGGLQFYGVIIVKGVVNFTGGGSSNTNIVGAVLAGKSSIDNTVLGGSAVIKYDQCALNQNETPQPPRVVAFREQAY